VPYLWHTNYFSTYADKAIYFEQLSRGSVLDLCLPDIPVFKILRAHHNSGIYVTYVCHNIRELIALNGSRHSFRDNT